MLLLLAVKMEEEYHKAGMGWLLETGDGPQLTVSKKMETSVIQPRGIEICQQTQMSRETGPLLAPPERKQPAIIF